MAKSKKEEKKEAVVTKGQDKEKINSNRALYKKPSKETKTEQDIRYDTGISKKKTYRIREYKVGKNCKPVIKRRLVGIKTTGGQNKGKIK
jgi:hypothetical protein